MKALITILILAGITIGITRGKREWLPLEVAIVFALITTGVVIGVFFKVWSGM